MAEEEVLSKNINQEFSDDRSMQRRHPIRRQRNLDEDETKDAMKILGKYVQRRYNNSTPMAQESVDVERAPTPIGQTPSAFSRNGTPGERLSTNFLSTPRGPENPFNFNFDNIQYFPDADFQNDKVEKIHKYQFCIAWLLRAWKLVNQSPITRCVILGSIMLGYAFLGGYIFQKLEHDQQVEDMEIERLAKLEESMRLAENLLNYMKKWNCTQSNEKKCLDLIAKAFVERSDKVEIDIKGEGWQWDFLNSVFFSATIFTTIGYGNLACKTDAGRIATIIYGLIGIPLMLFVLKVLGELLIKYAQSMRFVIKRCMRRCCKKKIKRSNTIESVASGEVEGFAKIDYEDEMSEYEVEERITTFPVKWALLIVFAFIVLCSSIVSIWENWNFLTAFYFFFVSLSTIGFGDVIPEHPKTACALFLLYFIGLALFSMVYAILQERVENQYMLALELIDQEYQEKYDIIHKDNDEADMLPINGPDGQDGQDVPLAKQDPWANLLEVRWRPKNVSTGNMPDRPASERRFSVINPGGTGAPPVLSCFINNMSMKKHLLARSESILNQQGTKRPSTLFPSNEMISNSSNGSRSPWPHAAELNIPKEPTALGKEGAAGTSVPNLSTQGNRSPSGGLSVITEASDEDSRYFKKHRKHLAKSMATDETISHHGSADSLDQQMDELQLESHDQSITPKPYRDPSSYHGKVHKKDEKLATKVEKTPLSPAEPLKEEDEEDTQ